jgi:hypothetical protein
MTFFFLIDTLHLLFLSPALTRDVRRCLAAALSENNSVLDVICKIKERRNAEQTTVQLLALLGKLT